MSDMTAVQRHAIPADPAEMRMLILKLRWMGLEQEAEQLTREVDRFIPRVTLISAPDTD